MNLDAVLQWLRSMPPSVAVAPLLICSTLMLLFDRVRRTGWLELLYLLPLIPLAAIVVAPKLITPVMPAVTAALVVALLARQRDDLLHSECALKLLWVLGSSLALSWLGVSLLALSTATFRLEEQWGVLAVMGDPSLLWTTSLALSLIGGFVLLGTAPFHFWVSDVLQGVRPWLAPLSVTALQACGAAWISARLDGISSLPQAEHVVTGLLDAAAAAALVIGAVTITFQRRPERRVGTLASLNGALALVSLALAHGARRPMSAEPAPTAAWSIHLALALSGAGVLARFLPVSERIPEAAPVLFRRHPFWGCLGLYSLASLAGAPGTPGSFLWLETARQCVSVGRSGMAVLLGIAWTAAFAVVMRTVREAFGIATTDPPPPQRVPSLARWTMAVAFVGLATVMASRVR